MILRIATVALLAAPIMMTAAAHAGTTSLDIAACAEEAAIKLPSIPNLTVTGFGSSGRDGAGREAIDAAGWRSAQTYGAEAWVERLARDGYLFLPDSERMSIRNAERSGQFAEANRKVGDAVARAVAADGNLADVIRISYTAGAIKGARLYGCVVLGNRYLAVPIGRVAP